MLNFNQVSGAILSLFTWIMSCITARMLSGRSCLPGIVVLSNLHNSEVVGHGLKSVWLYSRAWAVPSLRGLCLDCDSYSGF